MPDDPPNDPQKPAPQEPKGSTPQAPPGEMSREEKIAAAKAKAEAIKAQRAAGDAPVPAGGAGPTPAPVPAGGAAPTPAVAPGAPSAGVRPAPQPAQRSWATADNPAGQPVAAPQNPKIEAFGTITQSVELRCEATEDQNVRKLLGGLGAYQNPLRRVWQIDYRYYAEAVKRLRAAGYQIEGKDYLGRPLEKWSPEGRGWTRLGPS